MDSFSFNNDQREVLKITNGEHIVQAPAGCGKTEVLIARIGQALELGIPEEEMICLTFTNRAAYEMKERYAKEGKSLNVFIGNIHNFCSLFLKENNVLPSNTTLLDEDEFKNLLNDMLRKLCHNRFDKINRSNFFIYIMERKRIELGLNPMSLSNWQQASIDEDEGVFELIFKSYETVKNKYSFVDFDDLLSLTIKELKTNKDLKLVFFKWLQIDEVQDLNPAQWEIINAITKNAHCQLYFGDYEQSIFSFMGSDQTKFKEIQSSSKNIHYLKQNYRSTQKIINLLNTYLKEVLNSKQHFDQPKSTQLNADIDFSLIKIRGTIEDEMSYLASNVIKPLQENSENLAVIVRSNASAEKCSIALSNIGIEHFKISGTDFFSREEMKNLMAFLSSLINPFELLSWSRILARFVSNLGQKEAREFVNKMLQSGYIPSDLLDSEELSYIEKFFNSCCNERIVVFDTETTSLNTDDGDIIQIAAVEIINGKPCKQFEVYINTNQDLTESEKTHHISKADLNEKGKSAEVALNEFFLFLGPNCTVIAHNLDYDDSILRSYVHRYTNLNIDKFIGKSLDSLLVSRLLYPKFTRHKLEHLLTELELEGVNSHNALDDVLATVNLIIKMIENCPEMIEKAKGFRDEYKGIISRFKENYSEIYNDCRNLYLKDVKMSYIMNMFIVKTFKKIELDDPRLKSFFKKVESNERNNLGKSLRMQLMDDLYNYRSLKESDLVDSKIKVIITTAHKSKGLSFDTVIIAEAVKGNYPHYFSRSENEIAEDKRIMYVALSRAKKKIIITYHDTFRSNAGTFYDREISPFIQPLAQYFQSFTI
jgi:DNA helicase-2/ATP-dependent DNA helicase PcrA